MQGFVGKANVPLGLLSGPAIILTFCIFISFFGTRPFDWAGEVPIILFQMIWTSIPFVVIMLLKARSLWPWAAAIGLNVILYAYVIYDASIAHEDYRGANIGLGLFIFASPLLITLVSLFVAGLIQRRTP